ncbi:hypothetical protein AVEN_189242-1, partial [Araneus ventricosus]
KLAASLTRQECKLETSCCNRRSHYASNLQQNCCVNSFQTIAKTEYADEPQIRTPDNPLPKPVAIAAGPRLRKTDCANASCIYKFYFKLSS